MSTAADLRVRPTALPASKQRLRLWLRLLRASRAIEARLRDKLRTTFGITLPQFDVMAALARKDAGMTMTELSRELMVSNGNVTGIIDRLVTEKLVARKALAEDRRTFIVSLTAKGASQFVQPVHAARVSKDGLVYVSDRGGKRVQVFRLDGTYVTQVFIGRECKAPECGNGSTAASTAFSTDADERYLFVGNRSQARVMVFERRGLQLLGSFGEWGSAPGQFGTLHHMAADSTGNLYVTEVTPLRPENRRVQKFVLTGPSRSGPQ